MGKKGQFPCPLHNGTCRWGHAASVEGGCSIHPVDARTSFSAAALGSCFPRGVSGAG